MRTFFISDNSSGTTTPASLGGLREFTYNCQSTPLISSDGLPSPMPQGNRQRRASMQDAIDFRKIDSKLYDRRNGDLIFSLGYLSSAERLTVVVMKASNLRNKEEGKITMDPYMKVLLSFGNGKKSKKKKTSTKHNVLTPVWNEALTFNLPKDYLNSVFPEFHVCHDNKMGNDEILGRTRISKDSNGDERLHWDVMVNCRSAVARWHTLSLL